MIELASIPNATTGTTITISYQPCGRSLEIGSLFAFLHSFKGGLHAATGELVVRDMEGMIQHIASQCAQVLGTSVSVSAHLELVPRQHMDLVVQAFPGEEVGA